MPSGRKLYKRMAIEAVRNGQRTLRSAKTLKSSGDRGRALSLGILAAEEAGKALIYNAAGVGIASFVKSKPNWITTFREADLRRHEVKLGVLQGLLRQYFAYAMFYTAIQSTRKESFTKQEVHDLIVNAIHSDQVWVGNMAVGGRMRDDVDALFRLLQSFHEDKNRGLYVGRDEKGITTPDDVTRPQLLKALDFAEFALDTARGVIDHRPTPEELRSARALGKAQLALVRRAQAKTAGREREVRALKEYLRRL